MKNWIVRYTFGGREKEFETRAANREEAEKLLYKTRFPNLGKRKSMIAPPSIYEVIEQD